MFTFAVLIGFYAYTLFLFGLLGILYKPILIGFTLLFFVSLSLWKKEKLQSLFVGLYQWILKQSIKTLFRSKNKLFPLFVLLFCLQAGINLIGALGPELGFDALWYHLTLPKLYILHHKIFYIPGGLMYYNAMPKIGELLYVGALAVSNEILAKLIQFSFGLLCAYVVYTLSRRFFNQTISFIAVVIFYSNLVVDWESITAYIDLVRTFFEILALYEFIIWYQTKKQRFLIRSAIVLGLAITTKVLALGSLLIYSVLILFTSTKAIQWSEITSVRLKASFRTYFTWLRMTKKIFLYWFTALVIPLPWFIFAYIHTGNPVYPFFTKFYAVSFSLSLFNPITFVTTLWNLFTHAADPISPLYLMLLPLSIFYFSRLRKELKLICLYSLLASIVWYFTPNTGGGRFILPYLPAFSIACVAAINEVRISRLQTFVTSVVIVISVISIFYRFVANYKYIPVILGKETKSQFLTKNLNFSFGDFYDTDTYFKTHIRPSDTVLLYGFHNLYHVDFPFIDASWLQKGDKFDYIATQHMQIPKQFIYWHKMYENKLTGVQLYKHI